MRLTMVGSISAVALNHLSGIGGVALILSVKSTKLRVHPNPLQNYHTRRHSSSNSDENDGTAGAATSASTTPWNNPKLFERFSQRRRNNNNRFRQHVNPLARQFQQPTVLDDSWPPFDDCSLPLHVDIGCGKGGFLIELASKKWRRGNYSAHDTAADEGDHQAGARRNYLGLEIRPLVAQYAKERIVVHQLTGVLDFLGCNANVDLDRVLHRYHHGHDANLAQTNNNVFPRLECVTIQFPDPHFKTHHAKRRVVTPALVETVAQYMPVNGLVFLQSDIQSVLDDMRIRFRDRPELFQDTSDPMEYLSDNPMGVPTEREVSVLERGMPVFRALFVRRE